MLLPGHGTKRACKDYRGWQGDWAPAQDRASNSAMPGPVCVPCCAAMQAAGMTRLLQHAQVSPGCDIATRA